MKLRFTVILLLLFSAAPRAIAHQLDEFLQATTINVEKQRITLELRLMPGVEVFRAVFVEMNARGASSLSDAEQRAYAELVRHRLSLAIDGHPVTLTTTSYTFPKVEDMKNGVGDILLTFQADVFQGGASRRLVFTNLHQRGIAAYLVNCLVPSDPDIKIVKQDRNYNQSEYVLDYTQTKGSQLATSASDKKIAPTVVLIAGSFVLGSIGLWIGSKLLPSRQRS